MRLKLFSLAVAVWLALLSVVVISASTLTFEQADLYAYSDPWEVYRAANGDVIVSDAEAGIWHVSAAGDYTTYLLSVGVVGARPDADGDIWYTNGADVLARLNVGEATPTTTEWVLGEEVSAVWGLTFDDEGRVWTVQELGASLFRFDPATTELCVYDLGASSSFVLYQDGDVWLANWGAGLIRRLAPSGQVTSWEIPWSGARPLGLVADGTGGLWWSDTGLAALVRLEPDANRVTRYDLPLGTRPWIADIRGTKIWYTEWTLNEPGTVGVLDPAMATGDSLTVVPVGTTVTPACALLGEGTTTPVSVDAGSLTWVSGTLTSSLELDGWTIYELAAGSRPYGLASAGDYVWVGDRGRDKLLRLLSPLEPGIDLEKHTNGQDADDLPGPTLLVGDPVTWTYVVTNTGGVDLTGVTVVDDNGTPADPTDDYTCELGTLPAGTADTTTCIQAGSAVAGPYENQAEAIGYYGETPATDADPSHYFGALFAIDLEKYTNGQDADVAPGPSIPVGDEVTWTYVVTNTGNVDLTGVTVTDDNGTPADPADDYVCAIGSLAAGATDDTTCSQAGVAVEGPFENLAAAQGFGALQQAQDADASHYLGIAEVYAFLPLVLR
jgi:streptogramin lyase